MTNHTDRQRDALNLLVSNLERELERTRARIASLVTTIARDAQDLSACNEREGADAVRPSFLETHTRDLVAATAELAEKRDRLRELRDVIEFADR